MEGLRMEHVWLLVAAECVSCLWRTASSYDPLFIMEHVGQLLQDQLMDLCRFYDNKLLSDQRRNHSESLGNLTSDQLALELWNTDMAQDEVRSLPDTEWQGLLITMPEAWPRASIAL